MVKHLIVISTLVLFQLSAGSQPAVDTSYKSTYYGQKTTLFRLLPDTKHEIIFLGNSITDIGEWAEIWNNHHVKNRGISGDNTFGVLARLDEVTSSKPDKVFIMIGINDIARNTPDSVIVSNYKKIIENIALSSPNTKIIVQSILPTNNGFTEFKNHQNKDQHIRWVNEAMMKYCNQHKISFVNLYPEFLDKNGKLNTDFTNDGLHLNGFGYLKWKAILQKEKLMK